jgi:hypothetical protein
MLTEIGMGFRAWQKQVNSDPFEGRLMFIVITGYPRPHVYITVVLGG